ncbi:MAG: Uncharacterized protein PeribacterA2_0598 [Candidatus Peribacter riflensis]|uniref:DUF5652 domain-containing protein n=1 Tax=Candidatus Peribacter riflensis TaxID=1735162 RepID=A0A0S1SJ06_9BACT|nr:MAG: Uncharacterized protein PeribacterA2_0598 [Candidatus Peribacter riflensis]ALM11073.1 MAG: Uncharacterized protein PeribacterB2_0597 [Candidatus Peribacter riflensis]ALM12176.1 MAG: Uncharacterized protein PeribacterC2_0597 [Candidatus Peribacter riflensis]ALM13279.1 MAG: Uncharacterized protein PeribacterD1_0598 [Candidatus Peribacter riflensis]ALM14379.1 MAG: Uncharacterized protein PeribacterD2_0597 [Candidatus Peribacter riflensis]
MMNDFSTLWQNRGFMMGAYNLNGALGLLFVLAIIDLVFKGWALWRAARMSKQWWFVALLIINSMGILPVIFLLLTNKEYTSKPKRKK